MLSASCSSKNSASTTLAGIDPPETILSKEERMTCPEGRTVRLMPLRFKRIISGLYSFRTPRLLAFGHGVLDSHHTYSTESRIRILRTVTHSAGIGIFAGLYQKHSWAR